MAEKHAGGLYMSIGLTLNQLQSDFLAAEQTVKQGVAAINRQQNIVKLRMEADTAGLDAVADKTKILDVQERSLTQLLDLQRDKLKLTQAAYQDVAQSKGANSTAAKNLEAAVERERLAVARLETQLKSLARQKITPEANVADVSNAIETLEEKLERLNQSGEIVRIRAQVEMEGLDKVADAGKILEARNNSLNRQIELQRERVRLLDEHLQDLARTQGETATSTQRATIRLERERLALTRLEREAREVTAAISELNSTEINVSGTASISGGTGGTGGSGGSGGSTVSGGAGGGWTDLLPFELPTTKVAAFTLAIGALGAAIDSVTNLVTESIDDFRETQKQAYELNLDFNDAEGFLRTLRLGGGDIGDFEGFIRGISDAYVKGEYDDPEFIALRKYGAEITDATGRLKNFKDLTDEVYQAWKQADEAGEGIEFLQLVGGEAGVRDAIQFFKRYEEAMEDAAKILDGNKDNEQWHELERAVNLATVQAEEFKDAVANIFTPAAQVAAEKFFNLFHDATEWLVENKDAIQRWGFIAAEAFDTLSKKISGVTEAISDYLAKAATAPKGTTGNAEADKMMSGMAWRYQDFNKNTPWGDNTPWKNFAEASQSYGAAEGIIERAEQKQREFNGEIQEATKSWAEFRKADEEAKKKLDDGNPLSQYGQHRLERFKDELEDLKIEIEFDDDDYQRALAKLELWKQRELTDKNYTSRAEAAAIEELYSAKLEQIEQEKETKLAEIRQRISLADATEAEKRMAAIETEKNSWIQAGMEIAEAEQLAEQQKASYIRDINQKLSDEILTLNQNELQRKLSQIETEKQAWIDKGASVAQAEELAQAKIQQANQDTEKKLNQIRRSVASADQSALENKLAAIDEEKEAWIQAGMEITEAEELAQRKRQQVVEDTNADIADAAQKYAGDVAKAYDDAAKKTEASFEEAARKNEALRNDALNVLKQEANEFAVFMKDGYAGLQKLLYDKLIKSGVNPDQLKQMTPERLAEYQAAKKEATRSFLPNWEDPYSGTVYKAQLPEMPAILQNTSKGLDATAAAADKAAESLNNLAEATSGIAGNGAAGIAEDTGGAVAAYRQEDGSVLIQNKYDDYQLPTNEFDELSTAVQNATTTLKDLPTAVQGITQENPFADFGEDLQVTIQQFDAVNSSVEEVTVRLSDLSTALANFTLPNGDSASAEQRVPVNVNTSVQIDEAHAWDSEHIQELAERVADVLLPQIVSAIGGDGNSY